MKIRIGARMMKTALAVSVATGIMAFFDTTHGLVGAGVSAWLMIAPSSEMGKEWARSQFLGALLGALVGASHFVGWAPFLSGPVIVLLMLLTIQLGARSALNAAVVNCLFILEHTDRSWEYAAFRIVAAMFGLAVGYLVNRYVLPYTARRARHSSRPRRLNRIDKTPVTVTGVLLHHRDSDSDRGMLYPERGMSG